MGLRHQIELLLRVDAESKPRVYSTVASSAEIGDLNYWLELLLSAGIATLGLVLNSPAVVIGAMLISPLMGPILAAGLALAAADLYLGIRSILSIVVSVLASVAFSAGLVALLPIQTPTTEILNRTQPNLLDLGVALMSGLAGSIVVARSSTAGGVTALPGVAIAVSLMPPLCTVGFGVGASFQRNIVTGAGLLFLANLAAIVASAFLVFFVVRMDAPDVRAQIDRAILERASRDRLYAVLQRTALARGLGVVGNLYWRVLMLIAVLALLFVPLREALYRVHRETVVRGAVRDAVRALAPGDILLTQQLHPSPDLIRVALVVTEPVPRARIAEAERTITQRCGVPAQVTVRKVAGEQELALLRAELAQPPPPAAAEDLDDVREELVSRLEAALADIWPSSAAALLSYEIGFDPSGVVVRARYKADQPLDGPTQEVLSGILRKALHAPDLRLVLEHEAPPKPRRR
jgi:uncharacterized hydrophobic protein (TIGR00271 family)